MDGIRTMEGPKLNRWLGFFNVILGLLYIAVGISYFFLSALSLSFTSVVLAIFLIFFGIVLIAYHVHIEFIENWMFNNFGFMYDWRGRSSYLLFTGFMCISLGTFGVVTGIITLIVLIGNCVSLRVNNDLRNLIVSTDQDFKNKHSSPNSGMPKNSGLATGPAASAPTDNRERDGTEVWEEVVDPESGKKYYYNPSTGETSWTLPGQ
eukprot:TRINITY_DN8308_c0_g2_i1.p1 TRINITY_DN8308_c0_g2~~TRINITY_DN8308_c0_g2_i1.p1  ORF type:complete len:207 (+),score=52.72 TRINITY_DN8308_c0_g2_i1:677-1297(+)